MSGMAYSLYGVLRLPQEILTLLLQDHGLLVQARAPVLNHQGGRTSLSHRRATQLSTTTMIHIRIHTYLFGLGKTIGE